ncbi:hypothetical protein [Thalassospira sp. GB04J01]|uniref:glycosyltransferase n=1 Tax=Thalassospira sp. GB04J01 TaxID=1485225 RepID=UPI000C9A92EE|nr:hypothetical protein [Thalassospira sp. GB04J01]|tara:strand:+ start:117095 stop:118120 length:1026 start_codon:yes stop_codon:yes gene_type:complete
MKVAIGYHIKDGPWGGGNRFAKSLAQALEQRGHKVVFTLEDSDVDVVLLTDPRARASNVSFGPGSILRYLAFKNKNAVVVHRINECDERKNTNFINALLGRANYCADHTVFVGSWLVDLPTWIESLRTPYSVILNGADAETFNSSCFVPWNHEEPLRLVTHHWGGNWMKGFDVYKQLDEMLVNPKWKYKIEFTYIGNLPEGFEFKNARVIKPLNGEALCDELSSKHAYVTASICEPGGNHQNEAGACGLPLLYRSSGCLPEYCDGFGIQFEFETFEQALEKMIAEYDIHAESLKRWPHWASRTCADYIKLFEELVSRRDEIVKRRKLWRNPWLMLRNQLSL